MVKGKKMGPYDHKHTLTLNIEKITYKTINMADNN